MGSGSDLGKEECFALLDRLGVGVISLVDSEGCPYAVPVNYVRLDDRIYVHGKKKGTKADCISANGRCCLVAFDDKGFVDYGENACDTTVAFDSVVVRGSVVSIEDDEKKTEILRALTDKLTPEKKGSPIAPERVAFTGVFEIAIESITGKHHVPMKGHMLPRN